MNRSRSALALLPVLVVAAFASSSAFAQDDPLDDIPEAGEERPDPAPGPAPDASDPDDAPLDEPDPDETFDDDGDDAPLLDEEPTKPKRGPGVDTADTYRATLNRLAEEDAEQRLAGWEDYLREYPESAFREQIAKEIAEAEAELYGEGIDRGTVEIRNTRELAFPEGAQLENLNPATRIRAGFEFGIPAWLNLIADGEYALGTRFSAHAGVRRRFTGWALELGPRVALVKSSKLRTIVSAAGDLHVGLDPAILGLRPTLMAGIEPIEHLFVQLQGSPEFEAFDGGWNTRLRAGGNVTYRPAQPIALYVEGLYESKYLGWPTGAFYFHTIGFGMRFYPRAKQAEKRPDSAEVILGASVPMMWHYWTFHDGAASVQGLVYLE